jgi:cellulose synthase/poly-beta-1,6-N-acetylglucosamine synthase-like glycosyltransferase
MSTLATILVAGPFVVAVYAYCVYPLALLLIAGRRRAPAPRTSPVTWPCVTITVPVYNAETSIRATIERLLDLDYEPAKLQILVISDASTDRTDDIVRTFCERGVELLRLPERRGKTVAENTALAASRGDILVNVDSTILLERASLKHLVKAFEDPSVGVASGRDVSVGSASVESSGAESRYVGYEMWVRDLETRVGSIVGASGCFYGSRRIVHSKPLPPGLSWDFASALKARENGYRSVSVPDAVCIVPRAAEIRTELTRKVRTMARGLRTLFYFRALMNPLRYGAFAFALISHKLLRWLPYLLAPVAYVALCFLAIHSGTARFVLLVLTVAAGIGVIGIRSKKAGIPRLLGLAGFCVAVCCAGFLAWVTALRATQLAMWEPTPRPEMK